ncbi:MAG: FGGY-family carbohydrate kinase [bacterium]
MNDYILAIDLGTSGPKVALVSTTGKVAAFAFEETPIYLADQESAEQNPDDWWNAILHAAKKVLATATIPAEKIRAVSCTAQWSGTVAVGQNGQPLQNAIIWMDARGAKFVPKITRGLLNVQGYSLRKLITWLRLTGGVPGMAGKDSIAHILYLKNVRPEIYQKTYKFLEPKDYLNLKLCGKYAATFDSMALHWITDNRDLSNVTYDEGLVEWSTIHREKLPELTYAVSILGPIKKEVAAELGLSESVQVIAGAPDVQSAAIGSGAVLDFQAHLYIGTSSWLTCHVPFKKTDLLHHIATLPSAISNRYFVANEQENAGVCLKFLKKALFPDHAESPGSAEHDIPFDRFETQIQNVPAGSERVIFTPWLNGERTPVENHLVRAGFHNLSLQTTRAHLIRAVYEGVALNSRWLLGHVEKFVKKKFEAINLIGGGANSRAWCQIHADILNRPIRQMKDPIQANLRGAAFLAAVALGQLKFQDIPNQVQIAETFHPNSSNRQIYDELFKEFVNLYHKNKKIYFRLNNR